MQLFQSPLWTPIGVVATILIGYFTLRPRRKKALSYDVTFNEHLIPSTPRILDGIEIRYHGSRVNDVRMIVLRIWNAGTVPILRSDFDKPLFILINGRLLSASVVNSAPPELLREVSEKATISQQRGNVRQSGIQLRPILLNARDSVTIQAVVADSDGSVDVQARIAGIPSIDRHDDSRREVDIRKTNVITTSLVLALFTVPDVVLLFFVPHLASNLPDALEWFAPSIVLVLLLGLRVWFLWSARREMQEAHAELRNKFQTKDTSEVPANSNDE